MREKIRRFLSARRRAMLWSIFLPTFLFGDITEAQEKTYQKTRAQLRLEEQRRLQNQKIAEIRRRNAERNAAKAEAARTASTKAAAAVPKLRYTWIKSQRYVLLSDIAKFYSLSLVPTKIGAVLRGRTLKRS